MYYIKKCIKLHIITLLVTTAAICFYLRGPLLITLDIIYQIKVSNKSIATINDLNNYYSSTNMDISNLKYKNSNSDNVYIDIYKSKKENSPSPVVIYVHGGSWIYGNNGLPIGMEPIIEAFNKRGFTIISLSYELLRKDTPISKPISDVKDAIRWVYKNKEEYNFNTDEIGLVGVSSGAHLSLLAAYSEEDEFIDDESLANYPSEVKYVIDIFGPTELSTLDFSIIDDKIKEDITALKNIDLIKNIYSPVYYVDESSPSTLIIHSKEDRIVPYENALSLYKSLKDKNINTKLLTLESGSHNFEGYESREVFFLIYEMFKFLTKNTNL
ncbi:MAG: alpha/beta hydrolase [Clostridiales bacterium]|nr:alpha/beta hydrolase [Clostridiales bacterium]